MTRAIESWSPALSPGGDRVAYVSDRDGTPRVWVESLAGGSAEPLDGCPHQAQRVTWSVDGDWLAILVAPGGHGLRIPDAVIAATALTNAFRLATINKKDFRFIDGLLLVEYP